MAIDIEAARAMLASRPKSASNNNSSQSLRFVKVPPLGELKIRFLPPMEGQKLPGRRIWKHYNMPDVKAVTCLQTFGKTCPICKVVEDMRHKMDASIEDFESKGSTYFNVLILDGVDSDGKQCNPKIPYLLNCGEYNYWWLLDQISNVDVGDITDPMTGASVIFRRKKKNGPLDRIIARTSSPIASTEEGVQEILSQMFDMNKIWKEPDDEYLQKILMTAKALKIQFQETIERLSGTPVTEAVNAPKLDDSEPEEAEAEVQAEPEEKPKATPKPEPKKEEAKAAPKSDKVNGFAKPANAKSCFGQHKDCDTCLECEDELECEMFTENAG